MQINVKSVTSIFCLTVLILFLFFILFCGLNSLYLKKRIIIIIIILFRYFILLFTGSTGYGDCQN